MLAEMPVTHKIAPLPRVEYLRQLLDYSIVTGDFYWRQRRGSKAPKGGRAGCYNAKSGYSVIRIDDVLYSSHRLAWKWVTGRDPEFFVDHIDRDRSNNSWHNLRVATKSQNNCNSRTRRNSFTGLKGVYFHKGAGRFVGQIKVKGETMYLGLYDTAEEAHLVYCAAADKYHGEFARYA